MIVLMVMYCVVSNIYYFLLFYKFYFFVECKGGEVFKILNEWRRECKSFCIFRGGICNVFVYEVL